MTNKDAIKLGELGGKATLKKYGKKHFSKLAKKRWEKKDEQRRKV